MRASLLLLIVLAAAACHPINVPPGTPSPSDVNPVTGDRGGSSSGSGR